jgi:hypothetical protein
MPHSFDPDEHMRRLREERMRLMGEALVEAVFMRGGAYEFSPDLFRKPAPPPPLNPEREKAIEHGRRLRSLRDGSTFAGERDNAAAALERHLTKSGLTERDL